MNVSAYTLVFIASVSIFANPVVSCQTDKQIQKTGVDQTHCPANTSGNCR